jgi:class 3 adenylate cyclase
MHPTVADGIGQLGQHDSDASAEIQRQRRPDWDVTPSPTVNGGPRTQDNTSQSTDAAVMSRSAAVAAASALLLPLVGLLVLLVRPEHDLQWGHQPAHFWMVLGTAAMAAVLGWTIGTAARRRGDARLFLVSMSFLVSAGFLGLHALATPKVLLDTPTAGYVVATPIGLFFASVFAAWSSISLDGRRARWVMAHTVHLRLVVVGAVGVWASWSLAELPPLNHQSAPEAGSAFLTVLAIPTVACFGYSAVCYLDLARERRSVLLLSIASSWVLFAEATIAAVAGRPWHMSWWEWHVLMLVAFGLIAFVARRMPDDERFSDLYLDEVAGGTRDASVLFADLEGFTSFSEANDPAVVQAMLNTYFDAVLPVVRSNGGRLDRFIGDAVMVTFNVIEPQADHAVRASRTALELQDTAAAVAASNPGWPRFRVGVNSGSVAVGIIGSRAGRDYTVLGDAVNIASRLEGLATAGEVVISGSTLRGLAGARVSSMGEIVVKGRREPVEAWRLEGLDDPADVRTRD